MDKSKKKHTSFTLSGEALRLLGEIAKSQGISMTAVLEIIIREKAKEKGIATDGTARRRSKQTSDSASI